MVARGAPAPKLVLWPSGQTTPSVPRLIKCERIFPSMGLPRFLPTPPSERYRRNFRIERVLVRKENAKPAVLPNAHARQVGGGVWRGAGGQIPQRRAPGVVAWI